MNTPLRCVYIPNFGKISVKISVLGVLYPYLYTDGVKFGVDKWTFGPKVHSSTPNFTPSVQRVDPAGRKTSKSASE